MAASNPFRSSDLIAKYGWKIMPYLSNLGVRSLAEAQVLFVDSGSAQALDTDDAVHGHSFETPLATIDYAIGLCTASEGSIILVAPGHNEGLGNAQIDFDVAGVTCIGLGEGNLIPRIDFDHANASIDIGANGVTLVNLKFLPSVTGVLIGVDVESGFTNFKMVDCEFMIGEDGAGVDEFVKAIELKSGNHDCIFENVKILAHASAAGATHGITAAAACNRLTFKNVIIDGPYATGGIVEAAAGYNHVVEDCSVDVTGTNYSFNASSTFAKRTDNLSGSYVSAAELSTLLQVYMGYQLKSVPGSAMPIKVWYVDANISASGDGTTPAKAFKTLAEAITASSDTTDDWIFVFDYSGGGTTLTINKSFVHIIGNANPSMPYPRIMPASAVDGIEITAAGDRVEIANLVIGGGDQTKAAIAIDTAAGGGAYGVYIHDCVIGRDATAPALIGISVPSGGDAPYLTVENCKFYGSDGAGIAAAGSAIKIAGNATRCNIIGNYIQDVGRTATPAIWLSGSVTSPRIENNRIKTDTDTGTGSAITLAAGVDDGWINGNVACDGKDAPGNNPFVDGGTTNGWGINWTGKDATLPA